MMGALGMSTRAWAVIFGIAVIATGTVAATAGISIGGFEFSVGNQPDDEPSGDVEMVSTADYEVDGKMTLPTSISSGDVYLFTEQPEDSAPVHYGDYVDFSTSDATSGLTEGVDYHTVSLSNADTATFTDLDAGSYNAVLVDKSNPREYHYEYFSVEMPEMVEKFRVEQDQPVHLARADAFTRTHSVKSDDTVGLNADRSETVSLSADLDNVNSNVTDRRRIVERTITMSSGEAYLGKVVAENFNPDDGVSELAVTMQCDGSQAFSKTLYDDSTDELGSDNSYGKNVVAEPDTDPETCGDSVVLTADIVYDATNNAEASDDGAISDGETIVDLKGVDVYGDTLGSSATSIVG